MVQSAPSIGLAGFRVIRRTSSPASTLDRWMTYLALILTTMSRSKKQFGLRKRRHRTQKSRSSHFAAVSRMGLQSRNPVASVVHQIRSDHRAARCDQLTARHAFSQATRCRTAGFVERASTAGRRYRLPYRRHASHHFPTGIGGRCRAFGADHRLVAGRSPGGQAR